MGIILTQENSEHLLRKSSASFITTVNRNVLSEGHQEDDQELTANPTRSWVIALEKMAYMSNDTDISKAVEKTEEISPHQPEGDPTTFLMAELLTATRADVQSAAGAAMRGVLRTKLRKLSEIFSGMSMKRRRKEYGIHLTNLCTMCWNTWLQRARWTRSWH